MPCPDHRRGPAASLLRALAAGLALLGAAAGCRERLTSPVECPDLCPGGQPTVFDTVVTAVADQDSTYVGYVSPGIGSSLRVSNGLPATEDRIFVRFLPRPDSVRVRDTMRTYTIDSVTIGFTLQARDTLVGGLKLFVYRIPITVDSTTSFVGVDSHFVAANLIDSIVVDDSVKTGLVRILLADSTLARVDIPAADSGVLALGLAMTADAPTGIRLASIAANGSPNFTTHVHANVADTALQRQVLSRFPRYAGFVSQGAGPPPADLLSVGDAPSSRSVIRFDLPPRLRDSATILRATLQLTTDTPVLGLPNDPGFMQAWGVLGDLGPKSPLLGSLSLVGNIELPDSTAGVVEVDITRLIRTWQGDAGLPQTLMLVMAPEGASFTRARFRSTRSASGAPTLRVSYTLPFPFERP